MLVFIFLIELNLKLLKSDKLISVFSLDRHGSRSPMITNDNHTDFFGNKWLNPEMLTANGERMLYILEMHKRYKYMNKMNFISPKCEYYEIYFASSHKERAIMSALSEIQGLCPFYKNYDKNISLDYINYTYPDLNFFDEMNDEIYNLTNITSSFPNSLYLYPIKIYHPSERKLLANMYNCSNSRKILENNLKNEKIINLVKEFNEKFGNKLSNSINKEELNDFLKLFDITDQYISALYNGKKPEEKLKILNIDPNEFLNMSNKFHEIFMNEYLFGDKNKDIIHLEISQLLLDAINYMKKRVDFDINNEDISKQIYDFSKPKLVVIAGHDSTINALQLFIKLLFDSKNEINIIDISFGGSGVLEVYKNNDDKEKYDYSDYYVNYLINDKVIKKFKFDEFINIVEKNSWNKEKIDKFCENNNSNIGIIIIIIILVMIIIFLIIFIIYNKLSLNKKNDKDENTNIEINLVGSNLNKT